MLRRWQPALFPIILAACLLLSLINVPAPFEAPSIAEMNAVGGGSSPSAYVGDEALDSAAIVDVSKLSSSFLFTDRESVVLWLGSYKLMDVRTYAGDYRIIVLVLREGGEGGALLLKGLKDETEVYALFDRGENSFWRERMSYVFTSFTLFRS